MASSKNLFLLLVALFALVLLISLEVTASSDQTKENMEGNSVEDAKYGGPGYGNPGRGGGGYPRKGCRYGCCRGYRYGPECKRCCANAHEAPDAEFADDFNN